MSEDNLKSLLAMLVSDARRQIPTYPDQALLALRSRKVRDALSARFENGDRLTGIESPNFHRETGSIPVRFAFCGGGGIALETSAVLVLMNNRCEVIGLDTDHSAPEAAIGQDNSHGNEAPFALATAGAQPVFDPAQLTALREREDKFVRRRGLLSGWSSNDEGRDEDEDEKKDQDTLCVTARTESSLCLVPFIDQFGGVTRLPVNDDQRTVLDTAIDDTIPAEDLGEFIGGLF